ncbi:hypothetical protein OIO90_002910 [Microbotryomycetes sp. JL221]|nr:hypothetical protein OIO90_002910 [Microbotryomycetes sp. JL221]
MGRRKRTDGLKRRPTPVLNDKTQVSNPLNIDTASTSSSRSGVREQKTLFSTLVPREHTATSMSVKQRGKQPIRETDDSSDEDEAPVLVKLKRPKQRLSNGRHGVLGDSDDDDEDTSDDMMALPSTSTYKRKGIKRRIVSSSSSSSAAASTPVRAVEASRESTNDSVIIVDHPIARTSPVKLEKHRSPTRQPRSPSIKSSLPVKLSQPMTKSTTPLQQQDYKPKSSFELVIPLFVDPHKKRASSGSKTSVTESTKRRVSDSGSESETAKRVRRRKKTRVRSPSLGREFEVEVPLAKAEQSQSRFEEQETEVVQPDGQATDEHASDLVFEKEQLIDSGHEEGRDDKSDSELDVEQLTIDTNEPDRPIDNTKQADAKPRRASASSSLLDNVAQPVRFDGMSDAKRGAIDAVKQHVTKKKKEREQAAISSMLEIVRASSSDQNNVAHPVEHKGMSHAQRNAIVAIKKDMTKKKEQREMESVYSMLERGRASSSDKSTSFSPVQQIVVEVPGQERVSVAAAATSHTSSGLDAVTDSELSSERSDETDDDEEAEWEPEPEPEPQDDEAKRKKAALDAHIDMILAKQRAAQQKSAAERAEEEARRKKAALDAHIEMILARRRAPTTAVDDSPAARATVSQFRRQYHTARTDQRRAPSSQPVPASTKPNPSTSKGRHPVHDGSHVPPRHVTAERPLHGGTRQVAPAPPPSTRPSLIRYIKGQNPGQLLISRVPPIPPILPKRVLNEDYEPAKRCGGWILGSYDKPRSKTIVTTISATKTHFDNSNIDTSKGGQDDLDWTWSVAKSLESAKRSADDEPVRRTTRILTQSRLPCEVVSTSSTSAIRQTPVSVTTSTETRDDTPPIDKRQQRKRRQSPANERQILEQRYRFLRLVPDSDSDSDSDEQEDDWGPLTNIHCGLSFDEKFGDETMCNDIGGSATSNGSYRANQHEDDNTLTGVVCWGFEGLDLGRGRAWNASQGVRPGGGVHGKPWAVADPAEFEVSDVDESSEEGDAVQLNGVDEEDEREQSFGKTQMVNKQMSIKVEAIQTAHNGVDARERESMSQDTVQPRSRSQSQDRSIDILGDRQQQQPYQSSTPLTNNQQLQRLDSQPQHQPFSEQFERPRVESLPPRVEASDYQSRRISDPTQRPSYSFPWPSVHSHSIPADYPPPRPIASQPPQPSWAPSWPTSAITLPPWQSDSAPQRASTLPAPVPWYPGPLPAIPYPSLPLSIGPPGQRQQPTYLQWMSSMPPMPPPLQPDGNAQRPLPRYIPGQGFAGVPMAPYHPVCE